MTSSLMRDNKREGDNPFHAYCAVLCRVREQETAARRLCDVAAVVQLYLGPYELADPILCGTKFIELHRTQLKTLECAVADLDVLRHFEVLESLTLRSLCSADSPTRSGRIDAKELKKLEAVPSLQRLQLDGMMEVPLGGVSLPGLKVSVGVVYKSLPFFPLVSLLFII
jgi:hypothetical protein